nr:vegetative cell wall protein gp1 isoform X2 [Microcebus murinus]
MRHFVTRQRINVNVAAARLLARPDVPARPLPSPTASSQPLPPRPAMPPSASLPRPRNRRASSPLEASPATPRLRGATWAAEGCKKAL